MAVLALSLIPVMAQAAPITFTGSSGSLSASAKFDTSGTNLIVTLTNTSLADVLIPSTVLTALFFDIPGVPGLTSVSALLNGGSVVLFDSAPAGGIVGGEWAYGAGLAGTPGGATEGISSAGFGLFGAATFPGSNLDPPAAVDGLNYGITSAGDNPATGNAAVTGNFPLIQNSVVFTLSGLTVGFDPSLAGAISKVSFQYGTALADPNVGGGSGGPIPEPSTIILLGTGLLGLVAMSRKKMKK